MEDQQFCLKWNNFQNNIVTSFESLLKDEDFVDVTLTCEGKMIKAHKMILSACSPYFKDLLKANPCQHPIIILHDVSFNHLRNILIFMYHGQVNVAQEMLTDFLKTAESLKVKGLAEDKGRRFSSFAMSEQQTGVNISRKKRSNTSVDVNIPYAKKVNDNDKESVYPKSEPEEIYDSAFNDNSLSSATFHRRRWSGDPNRSIHVNAPVTDNSEFLEEDYDSVKTPDKLDIKDSLDCNYSDKSALESSYLESNVIMGEDYEATVAQDTSQGVLEVSLSPDELMGICPLCQKIMNKNNIPRHIKNIHKSGTERYECCYCHRSYKNEASLYTHRYHCNARFHKSETVVSDNTYKENLNA